ncbi:6-phosphogluconolactonase [Trypanosoma equiperdum]|uniref:6-phosphogluconolactonase n=1 Tax=Trypanosoma equiperdum TaxID=5694 RepID=A0A1G4IEB9_TRYEQ|nr:6-phosphogluconolactonase [Trypanosoma equiperdum]
MSFKPTISVHATPQELSAAGCRKIVEIIEASGSQQWPLSIALAGGSTPKMTYARLHDEHLNLLREKRALRFFMGDERMVPADSTDSNYNMAREVLLHDIPDDLVFPFDTSAVTPSAEATSADAMRVAEAYGKQLASLLPLKSVGEAGAKVPVFDVVLLGLGSDGHTASIFPGSQAEKETDGKVVVSVGFPSETMKPKVWRVTLSPATIMQARNVIVLATGAEKKWVVDGILADTAHKAPVARFLRGCEGNVSFLLDKEIAENLAKF